MKPDRYDPAFRAARFAVAEKRVRNVGRAVIVAGALHAVAAVVAVWWLVQLLAVRAGERPLTYVEDGGTLPQVVSAVVIAASVVAGVLWLRWFKAVYEVVFTSGRARHYIDMGVWGWILPVADLVVPKRMVNDVWRAGEPEGAAASRPPWPVQAWWALWLPFCAVHWPLGAVLAWFTPEPTGPAGAEIVLARYAVAQAVLLALSTPFAVMTVRILSERLRRVYEVASVGGGAARDDLVPQPTP